MSLEQTAQPLTLADKIRPRGNLVLIRARIESKLLTPDQTNPFAIAFDAVVVKVGPGMYNAVRGERVPIEIGPGQPLMAGDVVTLNPTAIFAPPAWKDERLALVSESEIWAVTGHVNEDEGELTKGLHLVT